MLDSKLLTHLYGTKVQVVTTPQGDMFVTPTPDRRMTSFPTRMTPARSHNSIITNTTSGKGGHNDQHQFSPFDPDWMYTLSAPFMTNAFLAGLCISLAAGVMGYFTIARHSTFAARTLYIGLPGATGAVLLGLPVSLGMGVFALGAGALVIGR